MNNIADLRKKFGVAHRALARTLGVSGEVILSWERGDSEPSAEQALKLAEALGVTVGEILANNAVEGDRLGNIYKAAIATPIVVKTTGERDDEAFWRTLELLEAKRFSAKELLRGLDCLVGSVVCSGHAKCPFALAFGEKCKEGATEMIRHRIERIDLIGEELVQGFSEEVADLRKQVSDLEAELADTEMAETFDTGET